ncbi:MAG TPA: choice-of-anchor B family protein [Thermoanaerobaculia bacterium]|nr:choice-of-anchor B family protein [Thermoanaerobaculia bacterium]
MMAMGRCSWSPLAPALLVVLLALVSRPAFGASCEPGEGRLCLQDGRFEVTVSLEDQAAGAAASAVGLSDDSGWFWLFSPANVEVMVKVLDGRPVNGRFWVFAGSLSTLQLRVDVVDRRTGRVRSYLTGPDALSFADTEAFPEKALEGPRVASVGVRVGAAHGEEIDPDDVLDSFVAHAHCEGGSAAGFPCRGVDLQALVPLSAMTPNGGGDVSGNDVWGWSDPATGREYALMGLSDGLSFVDVTDATSPRVVGWMPSESEPRIWRDVKTYRNRAYVVADRVPHGMQVFDLRRLRGRSEGAVALPPDTVYREFGPAHNLAIDVASGFAYAVGTDTCEGGLHIVDIRAPESPTFAGCFADDGYTHDAQCVRYDGPDGRYRGREICFAANEDSLTIVDVTDKSTPRMLARTAYPGVAYTHQAWLTEDSRFLLVDDEGDERRDEELTRTYVLDVRDLEKPVLVGIHRGSTAATDHNQYVHRGYVFQANYRAGLRILDLAEVARGRLPEAAFFDIEPADDASDLNGAWSVYPFLPSGNVLISGTGQGLVVLRPVLAGFALPAAPSELRAIVAGTTVELQWRNDSHHQHGLRVYRLDPDGVERPIAELAPGTATYLDRDLSPFESYRYRVVAFSGGLESTSEPVVATTDPQPTTCAAVGEALCLLDERFAVTVEWLDEGGAPRVGRPEPLTSDSGWFWFFSEGNVEIVVKVLDGRAINGGFWVFTGALSDVGYAVRVTDTATGRVRSYVNPRGTLGGISDTSGFADAW